MKKTIGIILAAGKGTRLQSTDRNKTSLTIAGKSLVQYGVDLYRQTVDETIVVVGAYAQSVKDSIQKAVHYVTQEPQLGTGHAVQLAVKYIEDQQLAPTYVFVGYGDHMMQYTVDVVQAMQQKITETDAAIVLVTTEHEDPNSLAWGRVLCDEAGKVVRIVEQKDASEAERNEHRLNAGFYCFSYAFLREAVEQFRPSPISGEYYLTDAIADAVSRGLAVYPYHVPFAQIGTGVNTPEQLESTIISFS